MGRLSKVWRMLMIGSLVYFLYGCQSPSSSSSSAQSSSSSSSSSSPDSSTASPRSGTASSQSGDSVPPAQSSSGGQTQGGASADQQGGGEQGAGDETLSEALEAFERARSQSASSQGQQPPAPEEEFPLLLPESSNAQANDSAAGNSGDAGGEASQQSVGSPSSGGAQTTDEKISVLDQRLEESYGSFDGMILRERGRVRGKENERGSEVGPDDANSGAEDASSGDGEQADSGASSEPISGSGTGRRPQNPQQREGEFEHAAAGNAPPADIPDGSNDDVVARQLREAAVRETDPELRDKLWDEYRKYKNKSRD